MVEKTYAEEAASDFKEFQSLNPDESKSEKENPEKKPDEENPEKKSEEENLDEKKDEKKKEEVEGPYISLEALKKGIKDFNWILGDFSAEDYMNSYTKGYGRKRMYLREFLFMQIEYASKKIGDE